jgi:hypothetical protein
VTVLLEVGTALVACGVVQLVRVNVRLNGRVRELETQAGVLPEPDHSSRAYREGDVVDQVGLGFLRNRSTQTVKMRWWWSDEQKWDAMEGDETVFTVPTETKTCPQCAAASTHYSENPLGAAFPQILAPTQFDGVGWKGARGPTRPRYVPGPVRGRRAHTLQRCVSCKAVWRVRLGEQP